MLEHIPRWLGEWLHDVRAGHAKLVAARPEYAGADRIDLSSTAFAHGGRLPERFTADGDGLSPPLVWGTVPDGTAGLALIVEDADAPMPTPLVHALVWGLPADERRIGEGAIARDGDGGPDGRDVGRNSFFAEGWLPPDPPTGHGAHDYVFQLFALSELPDIGGSPNRGDLVKAMAGQVIGVGILIGTYSRGEDRPAGSGSLRGAIA
jgi:Raf kinase inhibitor-like YbhB/YbcL family protein